MKALAVINRKGGCGKTTLAVNLAAALAARCRVAVVDLDPQQSATHWTGATISVLRPAALEENLSLVAADVAVLDTPPHEHAPARAAFAAADLVLVPVQPSPLDLDAAGPVLRAVADSGKPGLVVLTLVSPDPRSRATAFARQHLADCGVPVAKAVLCRRSAHVQAAVRRQPVIVSEPTSKAADEVRVLAEEMWVALGGIK